MKLTEKKIYDVSHFYLSTFNASYLVEDPAISSIAMYIDVYETDIG